MIKTMDTVRRFATRHPGGVSIWSRLALRLRILAERRRLLDLDERALNDIGISRAQAVFEAQRAPWDLPELGDDR